MFGKFCCTATAPLAIQVPIKGLMWWRRHNYATYAIYIIIEMPMYTALTNLLFPPACMVCHVPVSRVGTLCVDCFSSMQMISTPCCHQCGHPFAYEVEHLSRCDVCLHTNPPYDAARAIWHYDDASSRLIKQLKFADKTQLAPYLAQLMQGCGSALLETATLMAPVPLHRKRLHDRRYNQAMLLAAPLAQATDVPLIPDLLTRTRHTMPQTRLRFAERQRNVEGLFAIPAHHVAQVKGARILLIDDVMTTGATVSACAETLKAHGATWVGVLTLARRVKDVGWEEVEAA